jgi:hypothetical protein
MGMTMNSFFLFFILHLSTANSADISFTMDDPEVSESPIYSANERNQKILEAFDKHKIKGALFVCGMRIDNQEGTNLLQSWDKNDHIISSHGYSHLYFPSKTLTFENFKNDFLKNEPLITPFKNYRKFFRYPLLKEGDTLEKRDGMRNALKKSGYRHGYVSIDASDWYIDSRLKSKLKKDPKADLTGYRDFYLKHMWARAVFYDELAKKVFGREVKHTILIHHSLLNALFLDQLMAMFKQKGWNLISAKEAFEDPIYKLQPNILPAGESIVWASAKETGKFEDILRYPGEDSEYEKAEMDDLRL